MQDELSETLYFVVISSSRSFTSVQFLDQLRSRENTRDDSTEILFQSFLQEALVSSSGMGRDVHPLMLPIQHFPTLKGALEDGFGEVVFACAMPEPCKFPSPGSCQKRFLWPHKEVDLTPHPVVDLVLQVWRSCLVHWVSKTWIVFRSQQAGSMFHNRR